LYVALIAGTYAFCRLLRTSRVEHDEEIVRSPGRQLFISFLAMGFALGVSGAALYLPFYLGFSSQAGGILPNLVYPTRGAHLWVMFAPLLIPIFILFGIFWRRSGRELPWKPAFTTATLLIASLWVLSLGMAWGIINLPQLGDLYLSTVGATGRPGELIQEAILGRLIQPGGWITLLVLLGITLTMIWPTKRKDGEVLINESQDAQSSPSDGETTVPGYTAPLPAGQLFAAILVLAGGLVVLTPEFFFLRDHFGTRMNTIFKFYYQAWLFWGIAAAFGTAYLFHEYRGGWKPVLITGLAITLGMSLVYPALSLWTKTNGFSPAHGLTLDGTAFFEREAPDDIAAVRWLQTAPLGVVVEAVGGQYSPYGRVATMSGHPNILGWPGHQSQWGRQGGLLESRRQDVERIYRSGDWNEVNALLQKFEAKYVYIGSLEHASYRVNEVKFQRSLLPVFQQGGVTIYQVP
jgi:hypothetical protein